MSETDHRQERNTEVENPESLSVYLPPSSTITVQSPTRSVPRSGPSPWRDILFGAMFSVGGVAVGSYIWRNIEHPTGWTILCFSAGASGAFLVGRWLRNILFYNPFNPHTGETLVSEAQRYRDLLDRHLRPTLTIPAPARSVSQDTSEASSSFPPTPAVSDASSDIPSFARADYRPQSTDLSFRHRQADKAQKYKKFVEKEWSSAPSMMESTRKRDKDDEAGGDESN